MFVRLTLSRFEVLRPSNPQSEHDRRVERLESEIVNRDVLFLFWSAAAKRSPWVKKEWRIALKAKGLDGIEPVAIETPDKAVPPPELAGLHFNEWTLELRRPMKRR